MRKKSDEKKYSILNAALEIFLKKGFQKTSMSEVALAANCSKATLYQYYTSKEMLFYDAAQMVINQRDMNLFENLHNEESIEKALISFGKAYLTLICSPEVISVYKMLLAESTRNNIGTLFYKNGREKEYSIMAQYLMENIKIELNEFNSRFAAIHFFALIESEYVDRCIMGVDSGLEEIQIACAVKRAVSVFISAYKIV